MKTIADLKRRLAAPGAKVKLLFGRPFNGKPHRYIGTIRTIEKVQTNSLRFEGGSWLEYPKANETFFIDNDTFAIFDENKLNLVYEFLGEN